MRHKREDIMHRRTFLRAGVAGTALTLTAPYVSTKAASLTLRFAHFAAEDHPANIAAKNFQRSRVSAVAKFR